MKKNVCDIFSMYMFWNASTHIVTYCTLYSPTSDGSAAVILANYDFVKRNKLEGQAVEILAQGMATDMASTFEEKSDMKIVSSPFRPSQCIKASFYISESLFSYNQGF